MSQSRDRVRPCRAVARVGDEVIACDLNAPHTGLAHAGTVMICAEPTKVDWVSDGEARRHGKRVSA